MRKRTWGLMPLKELGPDPRATADARAENRIRRVWPLIVGPALVHNTRLLRVRHKVVVIGCWKTEVMASLRQSADITWPQVRARLDHLLGLKMQKLEIVPCDPPPEPCQEKAPPLDPLEAVLRKYRSIRIEGWTPKPK